jgi:hypothetical protein
MEVSRLLLRAPEPLSAAEACRGSSSLNLAARAESSGLSLDSLIRAHGQPVESTSEQNRVLARPERCFESRNGSGRPRCRSRPKLKIQTRLIIIFGQQFWSAVLLLSLCQPAFSKLETSLRYRIRGYILAAGR